MDTFRNYIGGEWRDAEGGATRLDPNPSDDQDPIGLLPDSSVGDADDAIAAAVEAFPQWRDRPPPERGSFLFAAADALHERGDDIARLMSREEGKPLPEAKGEVGYAASVLEYFGGLGTRLAGETVHSSRPNVDLYTVREPLGPVGLITPWNFPVNIPVLKLGPPW